MAQAATNPKIEELRFRLKTDPKSRIFYQLAEELRKAGQFGEAEQVLRNGLGVYPTYLAAWVSLGRVQRETRNDAGAVDSLSKALQLDPSNVVAARLLADAYLSQGQTLEALKKYKLVHALMPADEELNGTIHRLETELNPPAVSQVAAEPASLAPAAPAVDVAMPEAAPEVPPVAEAEPEAPFAVEESPFDRTAPPFAVDTGDSEPMLAAHGESPFEEPIEAATAAILDIEQPAGMHVEAAPVSAEVAAPVGDESDVFAPAPPEQPPAEDLTNTLTMADLYVRQGLAHEAAHIYENILSRDPDNADVRERLEAISPRVNPKIEKLERWLSRVARKEVGRV